MDTDTKEEFEAATGTGVDTDDLALLEVVDDEDPVDLDEKLPDEVVVDPLLALDEEDDEKKEDDELDDKAEIEAVMWQDYDER